MLRDGASGTSKSLVSWTRTHGACVHQHAGDCAYELVDLVGHLDGCVKAEAIAVGDILGSAAAATTARECIGAIDPATGMALDWNPVKPAEQGGHDFLATSDGLWVVSDSVKFHGEYHRSIAFAPLAAAGPVS